MSSFPIARSASPCAASSARPIPARAEFLSIRRALLAMACMAAASLTACGGGGDDGSSTNTSPAAAGTLTFTGTNNSGRTGFIPPTDAVTCLATKASFIQVNCLKPGTPAGTTDDLMITYVGAATVGTVVNLASGGANQVEFTTTELAGAAIVTKFWGSEAVGTITVTAIDAKSVTFKLAGISLKADTLSGSSMATGTILADGTVTVTLK